ncbi:MAG: FAD-dependent monooxygenase [Candidatus Micrarchaeaceae archaeon]
MISIVGAGSSGLMAARRLGELGFEAAVYDQKPVLGLPVRASGILSLSGLKSLGIDYTRCVTNVLHGANIHSGGKTMRIMSRDAIANVLDRKKFNDACREQAEEAGARVITGKRIGGAGLDELSGRGIVIGADGAISSVAKHFGLGKIERLVLTYKAEFEVEAPDSRVVDLFFDNKEYAGLFAWLCPNEKDLLEVGVGIRSGHENSKAAFDRFMRTDYVNGIVGGRRPVTEGASIIPMSLRSSMADDKRRVVLVGDAAGQVKPTTGGGIIFGGNGALMAADTISRYIAGDALLSDYERGFKKKYGLDLKLHSAINRVYSSLNPSAIGNAIVLLNALGIDRFLGTYGDMDSPSLVFKRFFLRSLAR